MSLKENKKGWLLIVLGILINQWTLALMFSADGHIEFKNKVLIWLFQIFVIILGLSILGSKKYIFLNNLKLFYKKFLFYIFGFLLIFFMLSIFIEIISITLLATNVIKTSDNILLEKFPAHFRMEKSELKNKFKSLYPSYAVGRWLEFTYDPVMGFRHLPFLVVYTPDGNEIRIENDTEISLDNFIHEIKKEITKYEQDYFFIITLGGSTTASNSYGKNWPAYINKSANEQNVEKKIFVLNAGQNGFTLFNSEILLSSWILPRLKKEEINVDLIISLDGVNDINFSTLGYVKSKERESNYWFSHYHGYHQHLDNDMKQLQQRPFIKLVGVIIRDSFWIRKIRDIMVRLNPYTLELLLNREKDYSSNSTSLDGNISYIYNNIYNVNELLLDDKIENQILNSYYENLLNMMAITHIREIKYVSYLQPVVLPKYYKWPSNENSIYPNINFSPMHFGQITLGGNFIYDWTRIYSLTEEMYNNLSIKYPTSFGVLTSLFITSNIHVYKSDAMHYNDIGSKKIAFSILEDLIYKKHL